MHTFNGGRYLLLAASIFTALSSASLPVDVPACPNSGKPKIFESSTCNDRRATSLGVPDLVGDQFAYGGLNTSIHNLQQSQADPSFDIGECIKSNNTGIRYCVYYSTDFANGRGISVVGTPPLIAKMLTLPAFTNPKIVSRANNFPSPLHERVLMPGKGSGMIAKQRINAGDTVMSTTPLVFCEHAFDHDLSHEDRLFLQNKAVDKLPAKTRELFFGLATHQGGDVVDDTFATNAFKATVENERDNEDDWDGRAIFPEAAWMNHDCRPNTHYHFNDDTMQQVVHATRTIEKGEELTDSYIDFMVSREERQEMLFHNWGFRCTCRQCSMPKPLRIASDSRLRAVGKLRDELNNLEATSRADPDMAELLLSLLQQERAEVAMCEGYTHVAREYNMAGKPHKALKFAHLALESGLLFEDECGADMRDMQHMVSSGPRAHWTWRYRIQARENATASADKMDKAKFDKLDKMAQEVKVSA